MIAALKPYPAYKDSGTDWLGEVPEHWSVPPNRALFTEVKERDCPDEPMLSVTITQGVIPQRSLLSDSSKKDSSNEDKSAYKLVHPDDIAYNKMRAWQGAIGASGYRGIVSPAYVVQRLRADRPSRFYHYLFRTPAFAKEAERWSYGITSDMWSLRPEHFKLIRSCAPPVEEQTAIVRFLDYMDRRIHRYIRAKQNLIKLLEEQKKVIIHQAVTGQIDVRTGKPHPAYKDSSIEWLGQVPDQWQVRKIRRCLKSVVSGVWGEEPSDANMDEHVVCVRVADFDITRLRVSKQKLTVRAIPRSAQAARLLKGGDILIEKSGGGDAQPVGRVVLFDLDVPAVTSNFVSRLRVQEPLVRPRFLLHVLALLQSRRINVPSIKQTTGIQNLDEYEYFSTAICLPAIDEQDAILAWIDEGVEELDMTIDRERRAIGLLREYRTCLIADAVTGKLDVREAAANLPAEAQESEPLADEDLLVDGSEIDETVQEEAALEEVEA